MADPHLDIVRRTAELARLRIDADEAERLAPQFGRMLEAFRTLSDLDLERAPAVTRAPTMKADESVLRADEERGSLSADIALANAPERVDGFYSVPKTIGDGS